MNILKDNHEYFFRRFRNGTNIQMNLKHQEMRIEYLNEYSKNWMNIHLNIYLNFQSELKCREYLFKYSFESLLPF